MRNINSNYLIDSKKPVSDFNDKQKKLLGIIQHFAKKEASTEKVFKELKQKEIYQQDALIRDSIRQIVQNENTSVVLDNRILKLDNE